MRKVNSLKVMIALVTAILVISVNASMAVSTTVSGEEKASKVNAAPASAPANSSKTSNTEKKKSSAVQKFVARQMEKKIMKKIDKIEKTQNTQGITDMSGGQKILIGIILIVIGVLLDFLLSPVGLWILGWLVILIGVILLIWGLLQLAGIV